jgi:Ras-related protein Rab-8A
MQSQTGGYDWLAKILVLGDSGVGKTNLLLKYCDRSFNPSHLATIGIDFKIKTVAVEGRRVRLQIWDTAGQDRFRAISQTYYRGAAGIVLAYSVAEPSSFAGVEGWLAQIGQHLDDTGVVLVLVATKADSPDRVISAEQGRQLAARHRLPFFETSAKDGVNVDEAFEALVAGVKARLEARGGAKEAGDTPGGPGLGLPAGGKRRCGC